VFTSATISATKDMSDFLSGIGAAHWEGAPIVKNRFPSPFDYRNNAKIIFLKKFAANTHPDFPTLSAEFIAQAAEAVGGGILVLFTSKDRQRKVHEALFPLVRPKGIELLSHGITHSSQHKAIQRFKQSKAAILMGARGLWKGVDIPGDDLQCLILEKMPYAVPNPFTKGLQQQVIRRCQEEAESQGARVDEKQLIGKAWNEVEKPSMFQAFRQMFGRLIRTETDRGVMIVLDSQLQNNTLTPRHKQLLELLHGARYGVATANQALQELALHLRKL
jgi:ATP-dependent DNA helicase DinG